MSTTAEDEPIRINPHRTVAVPLAVLVGAIAFVVGASLGYAALVGRIDGNASDYVRLDKRVESLEQSMRKIDPMARDIEWIVKTLEADRRNRLAR